MEKLLLHTFSLKLSQLTVISLDVMILQSMIVIYQGTHSQLEYKEAPTGVTLLIPLFSFGFFMQIPPLYQVDMMVSTLPQE